MKNKLYRILAIGASLALMASFAVAVPVSAAPGCNDWDDISMPVLAEDTEVGVMDIAPDGTMFAAFYDEDANEWDIKYSTDGGFKWKDTNLTGIPDLNPNDIYGFVADEGMTPVRIQVSSMWPDNKNVYVALSNGEVWRLPDAGLGTPAPMRSIVSDTGASLEEMGLGLWDMDIWGDGTYNYLVVATDLDVFVIKDALFEVWIDYELNVVADDEGPHFIGRSATEVRFAPDFGTSEIIWALVGDEDLGGDLVLTSADAPTRWGFVYEEIGFEQYDTDMEEWTPFADMEFDPAYSAAYPQLYVAVATPWWNSHTPNDGNLYYCAGESSTTGPGDMGSAYIFFEDRALGTVEVSGGVIIVQDSETGEVWITEDAGANWDLADRSPAAPFWGQLFMAPDFDDSGIIFSTVMDGGFTGVSGIYRSTDGGYFWDGISWLDMDIEFIQDLAFDPKGGSQPAIMLVEYDGDTYIFYTPDATAASPQWLLKDNEENFDLWDITMVSWDEAGDTVMIMGKQDPWEIWRSTDDGNSFKFWRTVPTGTIDKPLDWVVVNGTTVSVIGRDGFFGTKPIGTPIVETELDALDFSGSWPDAPRSIARHGDTIAVGTMNGEIAVSTDAGVSWKSGSPFADYVYVYVAFGPDGTLYAATDDGGIYTIKLSNVTATLVKDSEGNAADADWFNAIWVSPDNTLYAIGDQIIPGSTATEEEAYGSLQMVNDDPLFPGTATLDLEALEDVTENEDLESSSFVSFSVISGVFIQGEILFVVGDDLVWGPDDPIEVIDPYLAGDVLVQGAESGAYGRISLEVSWATANFMIANGGLEYTAGWSDDWPEPGYSVSITSSTLILNYESMEGEEAYATTMFRLLLGDDESDYNIWDTADIEGAWGLWGTPNSTNILWTIVYGAELWAFEDFNTGMVQDVVVAEVNKSPATATKDLKISWTALACTDCYVIWINGEIADHVTVSDADAGDTLTKTWKGFDYATKYEVQVQACAGGPLQSRLSAVDDVTTECYLIAPSPTVPLQGLQDAPIAPSFVWLVPIDGCAPTGYDFQMGTDPAFASTIVSISTTNTAYTYVAGDLAYDTNHYWRVRSSYGSVKSAWTTIQNFHTMLEPQPPVDITVTQPPAVTLTQTNPPAQTVTLSIPPAQTVTVSVPPAVTLTQTVTSVPTPTIVLPDQPTPVYIWIIVAVGAILTIAVIVLIIRTRRAE